jgi:hypothetical protein
LKNCKRDVDTTARKILLEMNMKIAMKYLILFFLTTLGVGAAEDAKTGKNITLNADTPWIVANDEPEAVQRALADVQRDWYKVFGHRPVVTNNVPPAWRGPVLYLGTKLKGLKDLPTERESFVLRAQQDDTGRPAVVAAGADMRGAIYAAYALSEEILGVDPWYYWTDHEPAARREIEVPANFEKKSGSPTFRYRGWFINDEDLLAGFAPDPLRENVYSLEMLDRICETLLRLRGNMIVPATFAFPDEKCWDLPARRGLALNMHHIQVVGLNTFRWPQGVQFSYNKNTEVMERYWRDSIAAYKGKEVVWTVGYRGRNDRPFWVDEAGLNTAEARGAAITKAIAKQVELIREVDPNGMIIANLWMEGAGMMHAGQLKLPEGVVVVWPDDMGNGFITDNGKVAADQGVYYHTAMYTASRNQLSEMIPPGRICSELGRFVKAGATNFFLVNVSDVRAVPLSTDCAMRFAWNAAPYLGKTEQENMDASLIDWSRRQFGKALAKDVAALYARFYDIPYHRGRGNTGDNQLHSAMRGPGPAASQFALNNRPYVAELAKTAQTLAPRVPVERRDFYQAHVLTQIQIHLQSLTMLEEYCAAKAALEKKDNAQALVRAEKAMKASDELFAALHRAETGKWPTWYAGDRLVGMEGSRDLVRVLLAQLKGEPVPLCRDDNKHAIYSKLYQYQTPFLKNFPLFYPASKQGAKP